LAKRPAISAIGGRIGDDDDLARQPAGAKLARKLIEPAFQMLFFVMNGDEKADRGPHRADFPFAPHEIVEDDEETGIDEVRVDNERAAQPAERLHGNHGVLL
jgi:hypothetical protein